jgi:hypothetical protein
MSQFRDQTWSQRFKSLGDMAETQFEQWMTRQRLGYVRYGLDRPPLAMHKLPHRLRYTPDYLATGRFYEVQGFGRDQTFKLKLDKWSCLQWWNDLHPVSFFVYDSHHERSCTVSLEDVTATINAGRVRLASFAEGKPYFAFDGNDVFAAGLLC